MNPKLSVVIIAYNHEKYIAQCINSFLNQSLANFEIIIVDDGSTDDTRTIVSQLNDSRIIYHYQENMGPSSASNMGISLAKTEFISLIAGDDMAYENRLEHQYNYFLKNPEATIVFGQCEIIDEDGEKLPSHPIQTYFESITYANRYELFNSFFFNGNCLNAGTCMLRRSIFIKIKGFQFLALQTQDYMMWFEWLKHSEIALLDKKLAYYRVRSNNQNLSSPENNGRTIFEQSCVLENILDKVDMQFFRKTFSKELIQTSFSGLAAFELEKAFLYLKHPQEVIQTIGLKKLFSLLQNEDIRSTYITQYKMNFKEYYSLTAKIDPYANTLNKKDAELEKLPASLKTEVIRLLPLIKFFHGIKVSIKNFLHSKKS